MGRSHSHSQGAPGPMLTLLICCHKDEPAVQDLPRLQGEGVRVLGPSLSFGSLYNSADVAECDALLVAGYGHTAPSRRQVEELWSKLHQHGKPKWVHTLSAGLEQVSFPALMDSDVLLTNSRGVYSNALAEYALTACNWFAKDVPRLMRAKAEKNWDKYEVEELRGKTMGVVGYGDIGQACARLARAFKMRVVGLRRRAELSAKEQQEGLVDAMYTPDQLPQLMSISDYVVMSTPYTPQTYKLVNAEAIAAMKPNAVFINVGRGKCVDEKALIQALKTGRIRGAGLDVFETEPLPADNELWELPNVFMSAHTADHTKEFQREAMQIFLGNLRSWCTGKPMANVIDKAVGY